jgi:ribosomal-protein-alanine N-acetyltransferase
VTEPIPAGAVTLSVPARGDAEEFVRAVQASRRLHHPWIDPPDTLARYELYLDRLRREDHAGFLIRHAECGQFVGFANVSNIVRGGFQSAYLGYAAFQSHAGRGLMAAGLRLVIGRAFGELGLHRVEANIQPANHRSLALVRRIGFQKEGLSPDYLFIDGQWRDHERWALLSTGWAG